MGLGHVFTPLFRPQGPIIPCSLSPPSQQVLQLLDTSITENTKLTLKLFPQRVLFSDFCHSATANFHEELKLPQSILAPVQFFKTEEWTHCGSDRWVDGVHNHLHIVSLGMQALDSAAWNCRSSGSQNY